MENIEMPKTTKEWNVVAKAIMEHIQCDNGYHHFEGLSYPYKWVRRIAVAAKYFFTANPDKFTDEVIEAVGYGGPDETDFLAGLDGWAQLDKALNEYFDVGMNTGRVVEKPRLKHTYKPIKGD